MDRRKRKNKKDQRRSLYFKSEQGYLLISTLFFLVFSGLFSHSVIKISSYQIMQLRDFSMAYKAKGALNMGQELLKTYVEEEEVLPKEGQIQTSVGNINIKKNTGNSYRLFITLDNGANFSKNVNIQPKIQEEPIEEKPNEEHTILGIEDKILEENLEENKTSDSK